MNQLIIYGIQSPSLKEILNEQNILYYQEIRFKSTNNDEEIKVLTSDNNKNGEMIKIVIGHVVASEGLPILKI